MNQYLLSVYQPDGIVPEQAVLDRAMADLGRIAEEAQAAGAWVFTHALHPADTATVVTVRGGDELITDGPYLEGKEHVGGFWLIQAEDLDGALVWARKIGTALSPLPIEVRPIAG